MARWPHCIWGVGSRAALATVPAGELRAHAAVYFIGKRMNKHIFRLNKCNVPGCCTKELEVVLEREW